MHAQTQQAAEKTKLSFPTKPEHWDELGPQVHFKTNEAATLLHLTERQLLRHCQAQNGCSCREYFHRVRMRPAECMLRQGIPVKEVAIALGYTPAAFTRRFARDHAGLRPQHFRLCAASAATALSSLHECLCPEI